MVDSEDDDDDVVAAIPVVNGTDGDDLESDEVVLSSCCDVFSDEPCTVKLSKC